MDPILEQYNVSFYKHSDGIESLKTINSDLTGIISVHYTIDDANLLLDEINDVINGVNPEGGGSPQNRMFFIITPLETKIYGSDEEYSNNQSITPDFTLPTADFRVIAEAWRDYLNS